MSRLWDGRLPRVEEGTPRSPVESSLTTRRRAPKDPRVCATLVVRRRHRVFHVLTLLRAALRKAQEQGRQAGEEEVAASRPSFAPSSLLNCLYSSALLPALSIVSQTRTCSGERANRAWSISEICRFGFVHVPPCAGSPIVFPPS